MIDCLPHSKNNSEYASFSSRGGIAPELINSESNFRMKGRKRVDVYALGGVIYHLLVGEKRFFRESFTEKAEIDQHRIGLSEQEKDDLGEGALKLGLDPHLMVDLVTAMVTFEPKERPTLDEVATLIESMQGNKATMFFRRLRKNIFGV